MATKTIKSRVPGIFYRRPNPQADPYVSEGDRVRPGDVVGLVEIMKNFYELTSEEEGLIERFLVDNEGPVDAGQDVVALSD